MKTQKGPGLLDSTTTSKYSGLYMYFNLEPPRSSQCITQYHHHPTSCQIIRMVNTVTKTCERQTTRIPLCWAELYLAGVSWNINLNQIIE